MSFDVPNNFTAGYKARADEVNANFSAVENFVNNETDNITIVRDSNDKLNVVGVQDTNSGESVKTWIGTQEDYSALATKDNYTIYYTTNTGNVYIGENLISSKGARAIGEIVTSTIPIIDSSLHPLDGTELAGEGIYSDFVNYIKDLYESTSSPTTKFFTTEATWQSTVNTYGVCGKYVYTPASGSDPAKVRLPKITGILQGTDSETNLGSVIKAGLPNITGVGMRVSGEIFNNKGCSGAIYASGSDTGGGGENGDRNFSHSGGFNFDASRSNGIYGSSSTVQPQTTRVYYYVVIASSVTSSGAVDLDRIVADLNGKANLDGDNMSSSVKKFDGTITYLDDVTIATITSLKTTTVSLSNILPNDNYGYLMAISCHLSVDNSNDGYDRTVAVNSANDKRLARFSFDVAGREVKTNAIIPIEAGDRSIKVLTSATSDKTLGTATIRAMWIRRMGTNV